MKYILFNDLGQLMTRYDSDIHGTDMPAQAGAVEVDDETFWKTINEQDGTWKRNAKGKIVKEPLPEPTPEELTARAIAGNKLKLDDLLAEAKKNIDKYQDMVDINDASADDKNNLKAWKTYRVALNRLDLTKDFTWPKAPE